MDLFSREWQLILTIHFIQIFTKTKQTEGKIQFLLKLDALLVQFKIIYRDRFSQDLVTRTPQLYTVIYILQTTTISKLQIV